MNYKKILSFIQKNKITIILIIIGLLSVIYSLIQYMPYWDEGVYTSNGKFIFSNKESLTYEYQRPPIMSLVIGFFWKIGLNEVIFSKLILIIIFLLGLFALYKIAEDIKKGSGVITTLLFASCATITFYTNRLLTSIPGTSLAIIGYYLYTKKKYYQSGLLFALGFLFRYTSPLMFAVIGVFLVIELIKYHKKNNLFNILKYGLGFGTLVVPFMLINAFTLDLNHSFIKRMFVPFLDASNMVAANAYDLVNSGLVYYIKFLFTQNLFIIFFIIFIIFIFIKKEFRTNKIFLPFITSFIYLLYLSSIVHYEPRYFIVALPYFAIISGFVITYFLKNIKIRKILEIGLIVLTIIVFIGCIQVQVNVNYGTEFEKIENYYSYVTNNDSNYTGIIGIDNPVFGVYNNNNNVFYLAGPTYAENRLNKYRPVKYLLFEDRSFICWKENDTVCEKQVKSFNELLEKEYDLVYTSEFQGTEHYIYKLK